MSGFKCPFCSEVMAINDSSRKQRFPSFSDDRDCVLNFLDYKYGESCVALTFYKCPSCDKYSVVAKGMGTSVGSISSMLQPNSLANQYPEYVPQAIRDDYEEACSIVTLSPKASATLSRRCLQGMIRDFWGISKNRLVDEIAELQDKVPTTQWRVVDSLRRIGNIGAHPEADVNLIIDIEPQDAQRLIQIIELLIKQWYIERYEQEQLYNDVLSIDEEAREQRSSKG